MADPFIQSVNFESRIRKATAALRQGKGILLIDNENRENEGDLIFSAEKITIPQMAQLIHFCSGIVCLCLTAEKADSLDLPLMVSRNTSRYGTNFTISIEAASGVTTGVSASDRVQTIKTAIAPHARPEDLCRPGHVFPLISQNGGVLTRDGHTEGSIDLMKLAALSPYAVLCELTNPDGSMAKGVAIERFAAQFDYPIVTISDIIHYRRTFGYITQYEEK